MRARFSLHRAATASRSWPPPTERRPGKPFQQCQEGTSSDAAMSQRAQPSASPTSPDPFISPVKSSALKPLTPANPAPRRQKARTCRGKAVVPLPSRGRHSSTGAGAETGVHRPGHRPDPRAGSYRLPRGAGSARTMYLNAVRYLEHRTETCVGTGAGATQQRKGKFVSHRSRKGGLDRNKPERISRSPGH